MDSSSSRLVKLFEIKSSMINKSILSYDDNKQGNFSLNLLSHDLRTEHKTNLKGTIILDSFKSMNTAFRPGIRSARFVLAAHWYYEAVQLSLSVHSCDHRDILLPS